jgi:hypothetical protein
MKYTRKRVDFIAWLFYHFGLLDYKDYENYKINRSWIFNKNVEVV